MGWERCVAGILASAVVVGVLPGMAQVNAGCRVSPRYKYFTVEGSSVPQLQESLRQRGPRDETGAARFAYTDWTVKWNWKLQEDGSVDTASVALTCEATILLPKVESRDTLNADLRGAWDRFVERTRRHELNHVRHVEQIAPEIIDRLGEVAKQSKKVSVKRAESIVSDVIAKIKARDRHYDAQTSHGRTEGTWAIQGGG